MKAQGFSLLELMVASSLALIVSAAATSLMSSISTQTVTDENMARVERELKVLIDRLAFELRNSGGNGVALRSAFLIVNNSGSSEQSFGNTSLAMPNSLFTTAKAGSDRLSVLLSRYDVAPCAVTSANVGAGTMTFASTTTCCTAAARWLSNSAAVVDRTGEVAVPVIATSHTSGSGTCTFTFSGQAARLAVYTDTSGLTLALTQPLTTFFIDNQDRLMRVVESWNGIALVRTSRVFADNVPDLQFMLGFDTDGDGAISSTGQGGLTAATDEWLHNGVDSNAATLRAPSSDLRMLGVGVIMSSRKDQKLQSTSQLFDGPSRSSQRHLRGATARMTLRNYPVFE